MNRLICIADVLHNRAETHCSMHDCLLTMTELDDKGSPVRSCSDLEGYVMQHGTLP